MRAVFQFPASMTSVVDAPRAVSSAVAALALTAPRIAPSQLRLVDGG